MKMWREKGGEYVWSSLLEWRRGRVAGCVKRERERKLWKKREDSVHVGRRREAAVGLWNAVSALLSLRGLCSHTLKRPPGSIQPRRLTAFLYTLVYCHCCPVASVHCSMLPSDSLTVARSLVRRRRRSLSSLT